MNFILKVRWILISANLVTVTAVLVFQGRFASLKLFGYSVSALLTVISIVVNLVIFSITIGLLSEGVSQKHNYFKYLGQYKLLIIALGPLLAFAIIQTLHLLTYISQPGVQSVLSTWALLFAVVAFIPIGLDERSRNFVKLIPLLIAITSIGYLVSSLVGTPIFEGRGFAMILLLGIVVVASYSAPRPKDFAYAFVAYMAILVSGSRLASAVGLMLFVVIGIWAHKKLILRIFYSAILLVIGSSMAFLVYFKAPEAASRISEVTNGEPDVAGVTVNTSGRVWAWGELISQLKNPVEWIFGKGPGFAANYGREFLPAFPQPHSEYVRVLMDAGLFGLFLFVGAVTALVVALFIFSLPKNPQSTRAALFVLFVLVIMSLTDNTFMNFSLLYPCALIVGSALYWGTPTNQKFNDNNVNFTI